VSLLISPAYAQATAGFGGIDPMVIVEVVLLIGVFYFVMFRPQQQKAKKHRDLLAALRRGDRVVTTGGIIGTVSKVVSDSELLLEIADGVRIRVLRQMITDVMAKTEPVAAASNDDDEAPAAKPRQPRSRRGTTPATTKADDTGA
jgi:preprotein translocase subunit YajC